MRSTASLQSLRAVVIKGGMLYSNRRKTIVLSPASLEHTEAAVKTRNTMKMQRLDIILYTFAGLYLCVLCALRERKLFSFCVLRFRI